MTTETSEGNLIRSIALIVTLVVILAVYFTYVDSRLVNLLQIIFGLVCVAFLPGYVTLLLVIQFPNLIEELEVNTSTSTSSWLSKRPIEMSSLEWIVLSVIVSLAIVPILGLIIDIMSFGITPRMMVLTVGAYNLLIMLVIIVYHIASPQGGTIVFPTQLSYLVSKALKPETRVDATLNMLILLLLIGGSLVVLTPLPGQGPSQFTEFYVLSENSSSEVVMDEYLSSVDPRENQQLQIGIENQEHQSENYTLITQVQRAAVTNRSVNVTERHQISRMRIELSHNESARIPYEFTIAEPETGCRVAFLLYKGEPPQSPSVKNAYRELHLWNTENPPPQNPRCQNITAISVQSDGNI